MVRHAVLSDRRTALLAAHNLLILLTVVAAHLLLRSWGRAGVWLLGLFQLGAAV